MDQQAVERHNKRLKQLNITCFVLLGIMAVCTVIGLLAQGVLMLEINSGLLVGVIAVYLAQSAVIRAQGRAMKSQELKRHP